jgi:hypothetical protein
VNHLRLHPRFLHNVPNLSIALQINSGTFVSVMPQRLRCANFPISNLPTIQLTVSSAFE